MADTVQTVGTPLTVRRGSAANQVVEISTKFQEIVVSLVWTLITLWFRT